MAPTQALVAHGREDPYRQGGKQPGHQIALYGQGSRGAGDQLSGKANAAGKLAIQGAVPYWEDMSKRAEPTVTTGWGNPNVDEVIGYAEFVEITDITPAGDYKWVMVTIEPLENPGKFETTAGPFKLEEMKSVVFSRARCEREGSDFQVELPPRFSASMGYVQVLRVRVRVHFCAVEHKSDLRSENQLVFIGVTDPVEISWQPSRKIYTLKGLDGNVAGNIYFSHRLVHRSDLQKPTEKKVVLGSIDWRSHSGMTKVDVYSYRYLRDVKEAYPDKLRAHAHLLTKFLQESEVPHDQVPSDINDMLKWVVKVQGNVLLPQLSSEKPHEIHIQTISSNFTGPDKLLGKLAGNLGGSGAKVKVSIDPGDKGRSKEVGTSDVAPYNGNKEIHWRHAHWRAESTLQKERIRFELIHKDIGGEQPIGRGFLDSKQFAPGFDGDVQIQSIDAQSSGKTWMLRVKVTVGKPAEVAGKSMHSQVTRGSILEPAHHSPEAHTHAPHQMRYQQNYQNQQPYQQQPYHQSPQNSPYQPLQQSHGYQQNRESRPAYSVAGNQQQQYQQRAQQPSPSGQQPYSQEYTAAGMTERSLKISIGAWRNIASPSGSSSCICICEIPGKPGSRFEGRVAGGGYGHGAANEISNYSPGEPLDFSIIGPDGDLLGGGRLVSSQFYPYGYDAEMTLACQPRGITGLLRVKVAVNAATARDAGRCVPQAPQYDAATSAYAHVSGRGLSPRGGEQPSAQQTPSFSQKSGDTLRIGLSEIETISRGGAVQDQPQVYQGRDRQTLPPGSLQLPSGSSHYDSGRGHNDGAPTRYSSEPNVGQGRYSSEGSNSGQRRYNSEGPNSGQRGYSSEGPNVNSRLSTIRDDASEFGFGSSSAAPRYSEADRSPQASQRGQYQEDYDDQLLSMGGTATLQHGDLRGPPSAGPADQPERSPSSLLGAVTSAAGAMMRSISHASGSGASASQKDSREREERSSRRASETRPSGPSLKVLLMSASNLRCADFLGKSDPYVKVFLKNDKGDLKGTYIDEKGEMKQGHRETNYIEQNLEPEWNEVVEFLDYEIGDYLYFEVWDKDFQMWQSDDLLGKAELNSNAVACGGDEVLVLQEAGDTEGKATLKVRVEPPFGLT